MSSPKTDDRDLVDYGPFTPMWQILAREVLPQILERAEQNIERDEPEPDEISDEWQEQP